MIRYEVRKAASGPQPYYWRVVAVANSKVLATSETYYNRVDAIHAVNLVKAGSATAQVVEV